MNEEPSNNTGGDANSAPDDAAARRAAALDALAEIGEAMRVTMSDYDRDAEQYWNSLTYDQRLMAFYSVCKRIHKGDIVDQGSYRHVLYRVFGFDLDSYIIGMECGYLDIHNAIVVDDTVRQCIREKVKDSIHSINERYGETLKRLAENERQERDSNRAEGGDVCGGDPPSN